MKTKLKDRFKLGQKIKHTFAYPMTCCERFPNMQEPEKTGEPNQLPKFYRPTEPVAIFCQGTGYVVGLKRAIMGSYKFTSGRTTQGFEDPYPEHEPAHASGKFEMCLVLSRGITDTHSYLVRLSDIVEE